MWRVYGRIRPDTKGRLLTLNYGEEQLLTRVEVNKAE
jgi:hypothetical protein